MLLTSGDLFSERVFDHSSERSASSRRELLCLPKEILIESYRRSHASKHNPFDVLMSMEGVVITVLKTVPDTFILAKSSRSRNHDMDE